MITLKKYLELNPTETEEERHLAEFAGKIEMENKRLLEIIKRASAKFCEDGSDGTIAASMFSILGESFPANV